METLNDTLRVLSFFVPMYERASIFTSVLGRVPSHSPDINGAARITDQPWRISNNENLSTFSILNLAKSLIHFPEESQECYWINLQHKSFQH